MSDLVDDLVEDLVEDPAGLVVAVLVAAMTDSLQQRQMCSLYQIVKLSLQLNKVRHLHIMVLFILNLSLSYLDHSKMSPCPRVFPNTKPPILKEVLVNQQANTNHQMSWIAPHHSRHHNHTLLYNTQVREVSHIRLWVPEVSKQEWAISHNFLQVGAQVT